MSIQKSLMDGEISEGHARAILGLTDPAAQLQLYELILKNEFSVRKVEELVRQFSDTGSFDIKTKTPNQDNPIKKLPEFEQLQMQLSQVFDAKVQFSCNPDGKGKIIIPFANDMELSRIMDLFDKIQ